MRDFEKLMHFTCSPPSYLSLYKLDIGACNHDWKIMGCGGAELLIPYYILGVLETGKKNLERERERGGKRSKRRNDYPPNRV